MTSKLVAALAGALSLSILLGWLFWSRASLKTDLATSEANAATFQASSRAKQATLDAMTNAAKYTDEAMAQRQRTLDKIKSDRDGLKKRLEEVITNDPNTRSWADEPLPDAIRQLLP